MLRWTCVQDTKHVLAQLREADFAAKEQQDKMLALQTELASSQQEVQLAQQKTAELETELGLQMKQHQHLLDELSQSQVCFLHGCCCGTGSSVLSLIIVWCCCGIHNAISFCV